MARSDRPCTMPRRDFLKLGSLTTLGVIAGTLPMRVLRAAPLNAGSPESEPLLSVGYAEKAPQDGESVRLQAGSAMLDGDPVFLSRGARLAFQPFTRAIKYGDSLGGGMAVDVVFPVNGYTSDILPRFRACSFVGREGSDALSGRINFDVPVTATGGVQLVVRRMNPEVAETAANLPRGGAGIGESAAPLVLGFGSRNAKLQRGVYVIGVRETADDRATSWGSLRLTQQKGSLLLEPAPFTYAVMTVDYAA